MASMAVLSVAVCYASAYISRLTVRSVRVLEMTFGCWSSLEGYQAENLGPIPPLIEKNNHSRSHAHLRAVKSHQLTCMCLDCGRKPEYPERTHADTGRTCKLHTEWSYPSRVSNPGPS